MKQTDRQTDVQLTAAILRGKTAFKRLHLCTARSISQSRSEDFNRL